MGMPEGTYLPQGRGKPTNKAPPQQWSPVIVSALNQLHEKQQYQYVVLLIDRHGRVTLETSGAFKDKANIWISPAIIEEARGITVDAANYVRKGGRKASAYAMDNPGRIGAPGGFAGEDDQSFDNDDGGRGYGRLKQEPQSEYLSPPPGLYDPARSRDKRPYPIDTELNTKRRRSASNRANQSNASGSNSPESTAPMATTTQLTSLVISDEEAVTAFFETRFRQMQQLTCKVISKAWIKVIEPKKQSNFPYNRGEESKPVWWPEGVRHREPDHLMKPERLKLLMTMLRCRRVRIAKLEVATEEVKGHIEACRLGLLEEVYKVAKMEERYFDGTLPPDTTVYVASSAEKITSNTRGQTPRQKQEEAAEGSEASPMHSPSSAGSLGTPEAIGPPSSSMRAEDPQSRDNRRDMMESHPGSLRGIVTGYGGRHPESPMYNSGYMSTPSTPNEYMGESQPVNSYPFARSASFNSPLPPPRRTQTMPQAPYGAGGWGVVQTNVYPQYSHANPQQSSDSTGSSHQLGGYQGSTATSYASLTPLRLPPHTMSQHHHHHHHDPHGAPSRHNLSATEERAQYDGARVNPLGSFQEFLAAPIPDMSGGSNDVQGNPPGHGGGMPH